MRSARSHHLAKHSLSCEVDVKLHFGSTDPKEIAKEIAKLGQKQLQAKFNQIFSAKTYSNNNQWLRRKLLEAAGIQPPKAAGRARQQPPRRSPSPANGSSTSSGPSCDTAAPSCQPVANPPRNTAPPYQAGQEEVRRTKRQRRPRTFDDMLLLDQPVCSGDSSAQLEGDHAEREFIISESPSKNAARPARPQDKAAAVRWTLNRGGSGSQFSDLSTQNSLAKLLESGKADEAALAAHLRLKAGRPLAPFHALDEQLIRAGSAGSMASMVHGPSSLGSHPGTSLTTMRPLQPSSGICPNVPVGMRHDAYDLGASDVRIATPHNRMAPSRTFSIQLTAPKGGQRGMCGGHQAPLVPPHGHYMQQQHALHDRRIAMARDAEAFANSLLNSQAPEALACDSRAAADWQARLALPPQAAYLPAGAPLGNGQPGAQFQGMVQRDPAIPLIIGAASPRALSLGSQASLCTPEPSQAAPPLQRPSDSPASAGSLTLPGSAAATNTPMDMIMLQGLGSLPLDGLACSSSESLMSDAMGLFDPLLPVAAL